MPGILLVAATERELCGHDGIVCGVGPVEAAAFTARALALTQPEAVLHVGVAGGRGLDVGTLVVGSEAVYADLQAAFPVIATAQPDAMLAAAVRSVLPDAVFAPITTSATVSAADATTAESRSVEAMEGFAVLRACELARVPAVEVRAVSNEIGEADRERWDVDGALRALGAALPLLLTAARG